MLFDLYKNLILDFKWNKFLHNNLDWNLFTLDCDSWWLLDNFNTNWLSSGFIDYDTITFYKLWDLLFLNNVLRYLYFYYFLYFDWNLGDILYLFDISLIYYFLYNLFNNFLYLYNLLNNSRNGYNFLYNFLNLYNSWHLY